MALSAQLLRRLDARPCFQHQDGDNFASWMRYPLLDLPVDRYWRVSWMISHIIHNMQLETNDRFGQGQRVTSPVSVQSSNSCQHQLRPALAAASFVEMVVITGDAKQHFSPGTHPLRVYGGLRTKIHTPDNAELQHHQHIRLPSFSAPTFADSAAMWNTNYIPQEQSQHLWLVWQLQLPGQSGIEKEQ